MNSNQVVRLTTSCSRFSSQNLPAISEKVVEKVLRKSRKLLKKIVFALLCSFTWSDAKICKLYSKSKISKHFCAIFAT